MIFLFGGPFATDVTANFRELPHEERRVIADRERSTSPYFTVERARAAVNLTGSRVTMPPEVAAAFSEITYVALGHATQHGIVVADPRARRRTTEADSDFVSDGYWTRLERRLANEKIPADDETPDPDPLF